MIKQMKRLFRYSALFITLLTVSACSVAPVSQFNTPSMIAPEGFAAAKIATLWWVMSGLGGAVFVLVLALLFTAYMKRQQATSDTVPDNTNGGNGSGWIIKGGIAMPLIVLAIVFGFTIHTLAATENAQDQANLRIRVIARRWWWEAVYPDQGITTANEIHIPVGVPVQLQLESPDVIHSFWVPELQGKIDVIPGRTNYITLQASHAGVYRGQCAEFCGLEHALMGFVIFAQSQADYNQWLAAQQQPADAPTDPTAKRGQQVFISAGCVFCHNVDGLNATNINPSSTSFGPDLTHMSSRLTIAGASLANNTNNLAGWVVDPQHIKQGSDMPRNALNGQDLQALLTYLQTLR